MWLLLGHGLLSVLAFGVIFYNTSRHKNRSLLRLQLAEVFKQLKGGPDDTEIDSQDFRNRG